MLTNKERKLHMKICYIQQGFYPENVPFYVHTQLLAALECEVHAIARRRPGELQEETVNQVQVHRLLECSTQTYLSKSSTYRFLQAARHVLSDLDDISIVHINNFFGASLLPITNRKKGSKWVLDIRSPALHGRWRSTLSNFRTRQESRIFDATMVHAKAVGVDIFGEDESQFVELPIGVDFSHFKPGRNHELRKRLKIQKDDWALIYSGKISVLRQLDNLLKGFHQAHLRLGRLHLIMVGTGDNVEHLKELSKRLAIEERVHFIGFIPYPEMPSILQAADIGLGYVPQTPWYDKAPVLKTLESLATGLPTIATATQGNSEYITNRENGLLVMDSPDEIADSISDLITDVALQKKFQSVARISIEHFNFVEIVRNILYKTYVDLTIRNPLS